MRKRVGINAVEEVEQNLAWSRALAHTLDQLTNESVISQVARRIVLKTNRDHRLMATLLCLSTCRFKEVKRIDMSKVLDDRVQVVKQYKTGSDRLISNLYLTPQAHRETLRADVKKKIAGYESLRVQLIDSTPSRVRTILQFQNSRTHIFRHLRASFMLWRGNDLSEITEYFAHKSEQATRDYIHTGLFEIFNSTQK